MKINFVNLAFTKNIARYSFISIVYFMGISIGISQSTIDEESGNALFVKDVSGSSIKEMIVWLGDDELTPFNTYSQGDRFVEKNTISLLKNPLNNIDPNKKMIPVKKPWKAIKFSGDANIYNLNTPMDWLWDGKPDKYPRIFHTARGSTLPHTFSFDLGRVYKNLVQFEEWGRQGGKYSNPIHFEVWGIEDIDKGVPDLPADDPGWVNESVKKGWTLLAEVFRTDDGIGNVKVDLVDNPPPVRYIRIRVKETIDRNKDGMSHMSELSFWYTE